VFVVSVDDPSGIDSIYLNIDSTGWKEMTPSVTENGTYTLIWSVGTGVSGEHVFQVKAVGTVGNDAIESGSIAIKKKPKEVNYFEAFQSTLPTIWFVLFLIFLVAIVILVKKGYHKQSLTGIIKEIESKRKPPTVIVNVEPTDKEKEMGPMAVGGDDGVGEGVERQKEEAIVKKGKNKGRKKGEVVDESEDSRIETAPKAEQPVKAVKKVPVKSPSMESEDSGDDEDTPTFLLQEEDMGMTIEEIEEHRSDKE